MVDREMLSAISGLLDERLEQKFNEKLQPVYERLDGFEANMIPRFERLETNVIELKIDVDNLKTKVDGLETDVSELKADVSGLKTDVGVLKADVSGLKGEMQYIRVVQLENNVIPRLSTIESCYLDTFQRYVERTEQFDKMTADIGVLKSIVSEHSRKLEKNTRIKELNKI